MAFKDLAKQMIGLTWQLWRSIRFPVWRHPIFQYGQRTSLERNRVGNIQRLAQLMFITSFIGLAIAFPTVAVITFLALVLGIPLLLLAFSGTVLGSIWVGDIAERLASIRRGSRFDLISMSQLGSLSVSWYLSLGIIYQRDWLRRINTVVRWLVTVVLVLLAIATVMLLVGVSTSNNSSLQAQQLNVLRDVITMSVVTLFLWVDHVQSIVIAHLLGLLMPVYVKNTTVARSTAPMVYLALQLGTYLITAFMFLIWQWVITNVLGSTFIGFITIMVISLMSFFIVREAIMSFLMRRILTCYKVPITEIQHLLRASA